MNFALSPIFLLRLEGKSSYDGQDIFAYCDNGKTVWQSHFWGATKFDSLSKACEFKKKFPKMKLTIVQVNLTIEEVSDDDEYQHELTKLNERFNRGV